MMVFSFNFHFTFQFNISLSVQFITDGNRRSNVSVDSVHLIRAALIKQKVLIMYRYIIVQPYIFSSLGSFLRSAQTILQSKGLRYLPMEGSLKELEIFYFCANFYFTVPPSNYISPWYEDYGSVPCPHLSVLYNCFYFFNVRWCCVLNYSLYAFDRPFCY